MTTKEITTITPRLPAPRPKLLWPTRPCSTEQRLERIDVLGQRIAGYVRFMCQADSNGSSPDARAKAIDAFYEQIVVLERQLGNIHENYQLE